MFFITYNTPGTTVSSWHLIRVLIRDSMSLNPNAMQNGMFLVEFYICHPGNVYYNATNQRYWLEYHPLLSSSNAAQRHHAHLIRPHSSSSSYADKEGLQPFRQWVRLIHGSTYIHGPFDFAVVNGKKSRDRIALEHWQVLHARSALFSNDAPSLDLPDYSIHLALPHTTYASATITSRFFACETQAPSHGV